MNTTTPVEVVNADQVGTKSKLATLRRFTSIGVAAAGAVTIVYVIGKFVTDNKTEE